MIVIIIHCASTNSDITNKKKIKNYYKQNVFDLNNARKMFKLQNKEFYFNFKL